MLEPGDLAEWNETFSNGGTNNLVFLVFACEAVGGNGWMDFVSSHGRI